MKYSLLLNAVLCLMLSAQCCPAASEAKIEVADPIKELAKEASTCKRKAMDQRVMSLNALKNADAARAKAHESLVRALDSGDSGVIDSARDALDDAADDLEDVIDDVEDVIALAMKAEMAAGSAESGCKVIGDGQKSNLDIKEIKSLLASAEKCLGKADGISKKLRRVWLEPFFASSTTSTTIAVRPELEPADK